MKVACKPNAVEASIAIILKTTITNPIFFLNCYDRTKLYIKCEGEKKMGSPKKDICNYSLHYGGLPNGWKTLFRNIEIIFQFRNNELLKEVYCKHLQSISTNGKFQTKTEKI